jgi:hypothetical protein
MDLHPLPESILPIPTNSEISPNNYYEFRLILSNSISFREIPSNSGIAPSVIILLSRIDLIMNRFQLEIPESVGIGENFV